MRRSIERDVKRFWAGIEVQQDGGCWNWRGSLRGDGYGTLRFENKQMYAHRVAYELLIGPIPADLHLDHLCRNRRCANPAHLEPVTSKENLLRGMARNAVSVRTNRCYRGHEFTPSNTRIQSNGTRLCRTCSANRLYGQRFLERPETDSGPTHCTQGHEFTEENAIRLSTRPRVRRCRECHNARQRERAKARRAERRAATRPTYATEES